MSAPGVPPVMGADGSIEQFSAKLAPSRAQGIELTKGRPVTDADYGRRGSRGGGGRRSKKGRSYGPPPVKAEAKADETSKVNPETGRRVGIKPEGLGPRQQLAALLKGAPDWAQVYSGRPGRSEIPPRWKDVEFAQDNPTTRTNNKFDARFGRGAIDKFYRDAETEEFKDGTYHPKPQHQAVAPTAEELGAGVGEVPERQGPPTEAAAPTDEELLAGIMAQMSGGEEVSSRSAPPAQDEGYKAQLLRWIGKQIGR